MGREKEMPLAQLYIAEGIISAERKKSLASKITDVIVSEMQVPKEYVWVMIHEFPNKDWMAGGLTVTELIAKI